MPILASSMINVTTPMINVVTCPTQVITTPVWYSPTTSCTTTPTGGLFWVDMNTCALTQTAETYTTWSNCTIPSPWIVDVDEEDFNLNHERYLELARCRAVQFRVRTAEQRRQQLEQQRLELEQQQQAERKRQEALEKSRQLLLSHLRPEQRKTFEQHKWFVVEGGKSKQQYRIRNCVSANIDVLNKKGDVTHRLCAHGSYDLPLYDHMLMQKILLQYDEQRFLSIANRHAA